MLFQHVVVFQYTLEPNSNSTSHVTHSRSTWRGSQRPVTFKIKYFDCVSLIKTGTSKQIQAERQAFFYVQYSHLGRNTKITK